MQRLFVFLFVLGVLLISGFATARPVKENLLVVPIQKIFFSENSWRILVSGRLSTPCLGAPKGQLVIDKGQPTQFKMQMASLRSSDTCVALIGPAYNVNIDLRKLMLDSGVEILPHETYTIKADGYNFEVSFTGEELLIALPYNPIEII